VLLLLESSPCRRRRSMPSEKNEACPKLCSGAALLLVSTGATGVAAALTVAMALVRVRRRRSHLAVRPGSHRSGRRSHRRYRAGIGPAERISRR
jgi:hypothetical protein